MLQHRLCALRSIRQSRGLRASLMIATASVIVLAGFPRAGAVDRTYPSQDEVERTEERVRSTERSVAAIRADLAAAGARLDQLASEAAAAFGDYYAAVEKLQGARKTADAAQDQADLYAARLHRQRRSIGALVADTYQAGGSFGQLQAYLISEDAERLLSRVSAYKGASDSMSSRFDTFSAHETVAQVYRDEAAQALQVAKAAALEAEDIRNAAQSAVAAQQSAVSGIRARRDALLRELAAAEDISVAIATQRQEALERIAAERRARAEAARIRAEEQAQAEAERRRELAAQREAEQAEQAARAERQRVQAANADSDDADSDISLPAAPAREPEVPEPDVADVPTDPPPDDDPEPQYSAGAVVVLPLPPTYYSQDNFGSCGSLWSSCHTGNDFSASCGTPVLASNSGVIDIRTDQGWSGIWLVQVIGNDGVVTWYAHMQSVSVFDGQRVAAGQQVGAVGTQGNSTGCHLHFEVRPGGGAPIDPVTWLAQHGVYV